MFETGISADIAKKCTELLRKPVPLKQYGIKSKAMILML